MLAVIIFSETRMFTRMLPERASHFSEIVVVLVLTVTRLVQLSSLGASA